MIYTKTIKEFVELIGSTETPVPAGGTTIAFNGLLGIGLLKLCFKVSASRIRNPFEKDLEILKQSEKIFYNNMEDDIEAFEKNMANNFQDENELKEIIKIPLQTAREASKLLSLSLPKEERISKKVAADFNIAIFNLKCCYQGAVSIIESNYQFFRSNDSFIIETKKTLAQLNPPV